MEKLIQLAIDESNMTTGSKYQLGAQLRIWSILAVNEWYKSGKYVIYKIENAVFVRLPDITLCLLIDKEEYDYFKVRACDDVLPEDCGRSVSAYYNNKSLLALFNLLKQ